MGKRALLGDLEEVNDRPCWPEQAGLSSIALISPRSATPPSKERPPQTRPLQELAPDRAELGERDTQGQIDIRLECRSEVAQDAHLRRPLFSEPPSHLAKSRLSSRAFALAIELLQCRCKGRGHTCRGIKFTRFMDTEP